MGVQLLDRELDGRILDIADELADSFIADLHAVGLDDLRLALGGLQLTFLSRVARLIHHE